MMQTNSTERANKTPICENDQDLLKKIHLLNWHSRGLPLVTVSSYDYKIAHFDLERGLKKCGEYDIPELAQDV